jgi:hypothetical protein
VLFHPSVEFGYRFNPNFRLEFYINY